MNGQVKLIKIGISLTLVFSFMVGAAFSKGLELKKKAGEYDVWIKLEKNPPILGDNAIEIEIRDPSGKQVQDANVLVNYYMPPMPRMPPMNYKTDAKPKKNRYHATMKIIMSGPWIIIIKINWEGKTFTARFNVDAQ